MSRQVVIDTNVLVALVDTRDKWHRQAHVLHAALKAQDARFVYVDCVMNEAISALGRRAEEQRRLSEFMPLLDKLASFVPDDTITWLSLETRRLYPAVIDLVRQTNGTLNFHDALIAVGCRELGIDAIVTFDMDFEQVSWLTRISDPRYV